MILAMFLASTLSASAQHRMSIEEMFKLIDKNNTSIQAGKTSVDAAQKASKQQRANDCQTSVPGSVQATSAMP